MSKCFVCCVLVQKRDDKKCPDCDEYLCKKHRPVDKHECFDEEEDQYCIVCERKAKDMCSECEAPLCLKEICQQDHQCDLEQDDELEAKEVSHSEALEEEMKANLTASTESSLTPSRLHSRASTPPPISIVPEVVMGEISRAASTDASVPLSFVIASPTRSPIRQRTSMSDNVSRSLSKSLETLPIAPSLQADFIRMIEEKASEVNETETARITFEKERQQCVGKYVELEKGNKVFSWCNVKGVVRQKVFNLAQEELIGLGGKFHANNPRSSLAGTTKKIKALDEEESRLQDMIRQVQEKREKEKRIYEMQVLCAHQKEMTKKNLDILGSNMKKERTRARAEQLQEKIRAEKRKTERVMGRLLE